MALRPGIKQEKSNWRARLREDCKRAAQQQRQQTLERYRSSLSPVQLKSVLETDMREAVRQEVERQATSQGLAAEFAEFTDADVDELAVEQFMRSMEEALYRDVAEELERLEALEGDAAVQAAVQTMAGSSQDMASTSSSCAAGMPVLCPVCQRANLVQLHGVVACPHDKFQLNLQKESMTLEDLRCRLAQVYQEHLTSGCTGQLRFQVQDLFDTGQSMTAHCTHCELFHVVV